MVVIMVVRMVVSSIILNPHYISSFGGRGGGAKYLFVKNQGLLFKRNPPPSYLQSDIVINPKIQLWINDIIHLFNEC